MDGKNFFNQSQSLSATMHELNKSINRIREIIASIFFKIFVLWGSRAFHQGQEQIE
jgi:hypothetical protein